MIQKYLIDLTRAHPQVNILSTPELHTIIISIVLVEDLAYVCSYVLYLGEDNSILF